LFPHRKQFGDWVAIVLILEFFLINVFNRERTGYARMVRASSGKTKIQQVQELHGVVVVRDGAGRTEGLADFRDHVMMWLTKMMMNML
jgi:hypothetical protein